MSPFRSVTSAATTALLAGGLCLVLPTQSLAAPPTAESFDILYFTTNAEAEQSRQMTANDLQGYVNQARCQCGQNVSARVRIRSDAGAPDNVQVRTYVGDNCGIAQNGIGAQNRPCALVLDEFSNTYTRNINFSFNPLWLATGVSGQTQGINEAVAARDCSSGQGNGGVWICVEDGSQTDCQENEFLVSGSQNNNATDDMGSSIALTYDFAGPNVTASGFSVVGGDGAVQVSWNNDSTGDTNGFRVLCAELDGSPVAGKGTKAPSITAENRGTIYYTQDNLCPDGPFSEIPVDDIPDEPIPVPEPDPTTGTGGGGTGGTGDTDGFEFGDAPDPFLDHSSCCAAHGEAGCDDAVCQSIVCETNGLSSCCDTEWNQTCAESAVRDCVAACGEHPGGESTTSGSSTGGSMSDTDSTTNVSATDGTASGSGTATDTDTDTDTGSGGSGEFADSPIHSLDWAYVCSDHLAFNASQARVTGLENGREYQIMVVAYDRAGNPTEASAVITAEPRETTDLWEQCEEQGNVCGKGGFCSCTTDDTPGDERLLWLGLGMLGLLARRRRPEATR